MDYFNILIPAALSYFWLLSNLHIYLAKYTKTMHLWKHYTCSHCVPFWVSLVLYIPIDTDINIISFTLINVVLTKILYRYVGTGQ